MQRGWVSTLPSSVKSAAEHFSASAIEEKLSGAARVPEGVAAPARLWIDYVTELSREAEADATRGATVVAIGFHPFVVGTLAGAVALRRVLQNFKQQKPVWVTNVDRVLSTRNAERVRR
jgi:hypothetical protein